MKSEQYEEICRFFLSEKFGLPAEEILSLLIPNPRRPGLPAFKHQIDLYWETGNDVALYLHIANAKWRSTEKVDQQDVMLLQEVKRRVDAHKAFMITSTGFTAGAMAVAQADGIALHIVQPLPSLGELPVGDRPQIQQALKARASSNGSLYVHTVVHRGFDASPQAGVAQTPIHHGPMPSPSAQSASAISTRVASGLVTRVASPTVHRGGAPSGKQSRGGGMVAKGGGTGGRK